MTHFASRTPDLQVAAHEAVHQLQHAGLTNDAGLGAEGQAVLAALLVRQGRPASSLIGTLGLPVRPAIRHYVDVEELGWGRLGETGETLTYGTGSRQAFASSTLIAKAGAILHARRSGIALAAGGGSRVVQAPDGSGAKQLTELRVLKASGEPLDQLYADCREASQEVKGGKGVPSASPDQAVITPGGGSPTLVSAPEAVALHAAFILFLDKRIRARPDFATLSEAEKKAFVDQARSDFDALPDKEKTKWRKAALPPDRARQLGIDQSAAPVVGDAFAVFSEKPAGNNAFKFHFAAVIMVAGPDRVTLENAGGDPNQPTADWWLDTYGPAEKNQSFHDRWYSFGSARHTLVIRNQPPTPADVAEFTRLTTTELLQRYQASTDANERYYLQQELATRTVTAVVQVIAQEDYTGDDEVFVVFRTAVQSSKTATVRIPQGTSRAFSVSGSALASTGGTVSVEVFEYDLIDPNDLIGTVSWASPYAPVTGTSLAAGRARYIVSLNLS